MKKPAVYFLWLFVLTAAVQLWGVWQADRMLIYLSKPLLLSFLSLYFYLATSAQPSRFRRFILLGLIFSIGGDTALMFSEGADNQSFFLLGLSSFLITHVFYILAFLSLERRGTVYRRPWWALPLLAYWVGIVLFLWPDLPGGLKWPVLAYSGVITAMTMACLNLAIVLPPLVFRTLFIGAVLFLASDSLIAVNVFKPDIPLPYPRLIIMTTYLLGQFLIATSAVTVLRRS